MSKTFSYGKNEKLKKRKQLAQLFESGQTFLSFPIKVFYKQSAEPLDFCIKAGVGVNKRNFKKAVHRNRIKRLLREAYRLNKPPLLNYLAQYQREAMVFFLYVDKTLPQKGTLQNKMPFVIRELIKRLNESSVQNT